MSIISSFGSVKKSVDVLDFRFQQLSHEKKTFDNERETFHVSFSSHHFLITCLSFLFSLNIQPTKSTDNPIASGRNIQCRKWIGNEMM